MSKALLSLFLPLLVTACTGGGGGSPAQASSRNVDKPASGLTISCAFDGCAPQVAALYNAANPGGAAACTAVLVSEAGGKSIVATNRHCIEGAEQHGLNRLIFEFPAQIGFVADSARGEAIVAQTPEQLVDKDFTRLDYAFVKLDRKIERPTFQMKARGIQDLSNLTLDYLDTTNRSNFVVRTKQCRSVMGTFMNTAYSSPMARIVTLFGCGTIHGSSGSAVRNADGEMVALLFEGTDRDSLDTYVSRNPEDAWLTDAIAKKINQINLVLRIGCIDAPEVGLTVDDAKACAKADRLTVEDKVGDKAKWNALTADLTAQMNEWDAKETQQIFSFRAEQAMRSNVRLKENQKHAATVNLNPICFNAPTRWLERFKTKSLGGLMETYDANATVHYDQPRYDFYIEVDEMLRLTKKFSSEVISVDYAFDAGRVAKGDQTVVKRTMDGRVDTLLLRPCPSQK